MWMYNFIAIVTIKVSISQETARPVSRCSLFVNVFFLSRCNARTYLLVIKKQKAAAA
jgi:hypothetical protein